MTVTITSDADLTVKYFKMLSTQGGARVGAVMERGAKLLQSMIRSKAPVDTGHHYRNIRIERYSPSASSYAFEVGTDVHYAWTLEYGFIGVDSAGRNINRPPRPHFRPAMTEFEPVFIAAVREVLV